MIKNFLKKSLNLFLLCAGIAFLFINFQPAGAAETQGEILQIKNLRIEKVSGENFPAVITAYYDFGTKCEKFKNLESSKGEAITCSVSGNALYTINIDKKTKLLLGNGREANLADFKTANLINLFGVLDLNTFSIKALIIRNTDNPQIKRLIQMNNLEVASEPKINTTPQKFNAGQKYTAACITSGSAGDAPISCPYGIEIEEINNATSSVLSGIKYSFLPIKRKYSVEIKPGAKILRKDFKPIKFGDIQKGDVVNIYGVDKGLRRIEAVTIRDLSVPKSKKGIIRAVATDEDVKCPEAEEKFSLPCGILYGANIQLLGSDGKVIKSNTTKKGDAIFENIPFGDYEILATASGYRKGREFVSVNEEAGVYPVSVTLRNSKKAVEPIIISASSTASGGVVGEPIEIFFKASKGVSPYTWSISKGDLPPGLEITISNAEGTSDKSILKLKGAPTKEGTFTFEASVKDRLETMASEEFSIAISTAPAPIAIISPNGGEEWKKGSNQIIKWAFYNSPSATSSISTVDISLVVYGSSCNTKTQYCPQTAAQASYDIAKGVPNNGLYEWKGLKTLQGTDLPKGKYILKISLSDGSFTAKSNLSFKVLAPYIAVITPNGGEAFEINQSQLIKWGTSFPAEQTILPPNTAVDDPFYMPAVDISLETAADPCNDAFSGGGLGYYVPPAPSGKKCPAPPAKAYYTIANNVPNRGSYMWNVGKEKDKLPTGKKWYILRVSQSGGTVYGQSDRQFSIKIKK